MKDEIYLRIDCYQCGRKLEFPFRTSITSAEYCYCPDCQEGVEIYIDGNDYLNIQRLEALGEK